MLLCGLCRCGSTKREPIVSTTNRKERIWQKEALHPWQESGTNLQVPYCREVLAATREVTDGFVLLLVDVFDVRLDISPLLEQLATHSALKWLLVRVATFVCLPGTVRYLSCGVGPSGLLSQSRGQQRHLLGDSRPVRPIYRKCHIAVDYQLVLKCLRG